MSFDEIPTFLDYALGEARQTAFDIQTLGGAKQYVSAYLALKQSRAAEEVREANRQRQEQEESEQAAYDHYRRSEAVRLFQALPGRDRNQIDVNAHKFAARFDEPLRGSMISFGRTRFTLEYHGDKLKNFEQWKAEHDRPLS